MSPSAVLKYRRLHAPRDDRSTVIEPPLSEVASLLQANRACRDTCRCDLRGKSLLELSVQARQEVFRAALQYTRAYRDVTLAGDGTQLFLSGHQPELFHPGVWFKNFALSNLAECHRAVGVNLVIDSDIVRNVALRVPGGSVAEPVVSAIPFDVSGAQVPHEERAVLDRKLLTSFPSRVREQIGTLTPDPLLPEFWPGVVEAAEAGANLGQSLAQGRHRYERQCGLNTLELPQSAVCSQPAFHWFVLHLLAELPRFRRVYNEAVQEYRQVHRIRSANHPVPDLEQQEPWLEAPFWIWRTEDPRRRRLFVRRTLTELVLHDRRTTEIRLPLTGDASNAVAILTGLPDRGIKLRTRALATTLWGRLVLSDLFLHGIGGAKYDQLTDLLMRRFFEIEPPGYLTLSATVMLPIARHRVQSGDRQRIQQELRELTFHPECFVDRVGQSGVPVSTELCTAVAEKARWVAISQTNANARQRCQAIRRANESLQPVLAGLRSQRQESFDLISRQLQGERVLASREYGFCLYPAGMLREFLQRAGVETVACASAQC